MRHLRVVDENGEILDGCPECVGKDHELRELQRKMKAMARELGILRSNRAAEAVEHRAWPILVRLFQYWQQQCNHPRSRWNPQRFWDALPLLGTWGAANFAAAIAGIAFQPNARQLKNGKWEVYDSWELLTRDSGTFERYMRRRPKGWECPGVFREVQYEPDGQLSQAREGAAAVGQAGVGQTVLSGTG